MKKPRVTKMPTYLKAMPIGDARRALRNSGITLTEKQSLFFNHIMNGMPIKEAESSGIYDRSAYLSAQNVVNLLLSAFVATEGATIALGRLMRILNDDSAPPAVHISAATAVLKMAGLAEKPVLKQDNSGADVRAMGIAGLQAEIDRLQGAMESRTIDSAPNDAPTDDEVPDYIE